METESFGKTVREQRLAERLSQEDLARKVGISRNYLSEIERGKATNLSWQVMERLSTALGLKGQPKADDEIDRSVQPSLAEYAKSKRLPDADVQMLARLQYRGQQPTTAEGWALLYTAIKVATGSE